MLRFRPAAIAVLAAAASALTGAAPASAGPLVASASCPEVTSTPVFAPWLDPASYFLAPDGGFEDKGAGWALDGASVVAGNEPYEVSGPGRRSLALPPGSTATSPVVCVGIERPTVRFFAKRTSGGLLASLQVDVSFEDALGTVHTVPAGVTSASPSWEPGPVMVVLPSLLPLLPGDHTPVTFRFTAADGGWQVDDVHVDPYGSR